jgi:O-antigen/teichoic acid export membrane protein
MSDMRQQTVSGLRWTTLSQASRLGTQLLSVLILARLLPPSDYGLVAMAAMVTGFASLFSDFGTAAAIIQRPDPSPELLDSVFWLNVSFGVVLAGLLGLIAPLIAFGFAEPRLKEVLRVLLLAFPIASLGAVHQALLEKVSRFRPLAIIESGAAFIGLAGAIWAARSGWGVYSLVLQSLLAAFLSTAGLWLVSQWRPAFKWKTNEILGVMVFSRNLVGFNVFNYFIRNADNILIGRFLGASELGFYSMAYRLMLWPLQNISQVVGRVLFPVFVRLQADQDRLANAYIRATSAITLITAPLMFGFFVLREPFVAVALGDRWLPVANILAWLVPVGLLQSIGTTVGTLYLATGRTDVMFKWGIGAGLLVIPAFCIGLQWGIVGVATAYAIVSLLLFWPSLAIPFRWVGLKVSDVLLRLMPSIATAAVMAGVIEVMAVAWPANTNNQLLRLILLVVVGMVTYGGLSMCTQRALLKDIIRAVFNRQ